MNISDAFSISRVFRPCWKDTGASQHPQKHHPRHKPLGLQPPYSLCETRSPAWKGFCDAADPSTLARNRMNSTRKRKNPKHKAKSLGV